MKNVVVGAGVAGTHAALTLLERGEPVELWDVGREEIAFTAPGVSFVELKRRLEKPVEHLLGPGLEALIPPDADELLRYPPVRRFLASRDDPLWRFQSEGFDAFGSLACGGLANGWGANALAFDDDDLRGWPVSFADMEDVYRKVCMRVPVAGPQEDDLSPHLRGVHPSQPPVPLTATDERFVHAWMRRREAMAGRGLRLGRARLAVVTKADDPRACDRCNRCLWGCPRGSIYNPAHATLAACRAHSGFTYRPGREVVAATARDGRVTGLHYRDTARGALHAEDCDRVFLAAGALQTGAIFLRTIEALRPDLGAEGEGLMDTAVVKIPYLALGSLGRPAEERAFQFNRLIVGVELNEAGWPRHLHGEVLHLTSLIYHPLIERMPFDSATSKRLFFAIRSALGVVTLFFPDRLDRENRQQLVAGRDEIGAVTLRYREGPDKLALMDATVARVRAALWRLGCLPRAAVRSPSGGGIHYAGTVPMGDGPRRCDAWGRSRLLPNLVIADGAAFPNLPSKSITLSLAAWATRVASAPPF